MSGTITATILVIAMMAGTSGVNAANCTLQSLTPDGESLSVPGVGKVALGTADDVARPAAWQGPLVSGACTFDIGIIELPIFASKPGHLYVTTYSGAVRRMSLVDFKSCKVSWQSKPFVGPVQVEAGGLKLGKSRLNFDARCGLKLER